MCMKIVQEYLKTLDPDKLYDTYCSKYGAFKDVSAMSVPPEVMQKKREYYENRRGNFHAYIERLLSLTPSVSEEVSILLSYPGLDESEWMIEPITEMFLQSDILEKADADLTPYAYEFTAQEEIMSFLVSDAPYTQHHLFELMADVLYEASWFGYEQEGLEDAINKLDKAKEEVKAGHTKPFHFEDFFPKDIVDEYEEEKRELGEEGECLQHNVFEAENALNRYSMLKQVGRVRDEMKRGNMPPTSIVK